MTAPIFERGTRVALVQRKDKPHLFGVAMAGGRYVVDLPEGYDGFTKVFWSCGWIGVFRDGLPPLLADTTTGKHSPMNEEAAACFLHDYVAPTMH